MILVLITARYAEKMLRKSLEEQFGVPLADRKALVRAEVRPDT
jgi:hypothetical protein